MRTRRWRVAVSVLSAVAALACAQPGFAQAPAQPPQIVPAAPKPTPPAPAPARKPAKPPATPPSASPATQPESPGADLAFGAYQRGYFLTAFHEATKNVDQRQDPKAMTLLGELYANGLGVPANDVQAAKWYSLAAERGDREAMFALAMFRIGGRGGPRDGAEAARLLAAFGVTVLATDARRTVAPSGVAELHPPDALEDLLPRADFVILTVPHTPATEGFFNRARFQRMKRTAFFINIGRGMTTRLDDLVAALQAGEIAGAALDVYELEPLPSEHPLWALPNVLLTPHMAGHGPYLDERRFEIMADNCRAFATGRPLRNQVDKASWF